MTEADIVQREIAQLPPRVRLAFQPLVKRAMGLAVGCVFGLGIFVVTLYTHFLAPKASLIGIISNYFHGYDISILGAFIGLFWGFFSGFVMGWFFAFARNFFVALWILGIKAKAQLQANRDFLDHI